MFTGLKRYKVYYHIGRRKSRAFVDAEGAQDAMQKIRDGIVFDHCIRITPKVNIIQKIREIFYIP